jgi:hypothetical protein
VVVGEEKRHQGKEAQEQKKTQGKRHKKRIEATE